MEAMRIFYALTVHAANKRLVSLPITLASSPPDALDAVFSLQAFACIKDLFPPPNRSKQLLGRHMNKVIMKKI